MLRDFLWVANNELIPEIKELKASGHEFFRQKCTQKGKVL